MTSYGSFLYGILAQCPKIISSFLSMSWIFSPRGLPYLSNTFMIEDRHEKIIKEISIILSSIMMFSVGSIEKRGGMK